MDSIERAAERLAAAQRLLVATAAGMSAESGIPVYRRPGSTAWKNYGAFERLGIKAEDLSCPQALEEQPALAWGFLEWKRRLIAAQEPHPGYAALHRLAAVAPEAFLQTTNVDGLHLRAGWDPARLHEVHGSLWRLQCLGPCSRRAWEERRVPLLDLDEPTLHARDWPRCPDCGRTARPHALLFADLDYVGDLPAEEARRAFHDAGPDVMLIVGESGVIPTHVHDARTLRRLHGTYVINVNPDASSKGAQHADLQLSLGAQAALCELEARVAALR
ncbi:MAG: Sir2 family NAD-dependent protein deacetylase [Planctomycetota bacterium]